MKNLKNEIWKSIVGHEGRYKVSNYGRLFSEITQTLLIKDQPRQIGKSREVLVRSHFNVEDIKYEKLIEKLKTITSCPEEKWKPVVGYENYYEVSNLGRVKSLGRYKENKGWYRARILKPCSNKLGYKSVCISNEIEKKQITVHRIVALAWLDKPFNKNVINHIDADPANNKVENLEWCTQKENIQHALTIGTKKRAVVKIRKYREFTSEEMGEIYEMLKQKIMATRIANKLNVSVWRVRNIKYKLTGTR